jgi:hypothetical protein
MKIIFSYWSQAKPEHNSVFKELAAVSNYFAQQHGYETILYTDVAGNLLLNKIEYDQIILMPEHILNQFPQTGWSLGKLLATSMTNEPFLHLDFDLFLFKPIEEKFLNKEAVFFHDEIWMDETLANSSFILKKKPEILKDINNYRSYNCAIFGGNNYKAFQDSAKYICNFAMVNASFLEKMSMQQRVLKRKKLVNDYIYLAIMLEQLWMPQILLKKGVKNIETILYEESMGKYINKNYAENIDVTNFTQQEKNSEHDTEYREFYNLLNKSATEKGYIHYFARNKENYKEKIISFAREKSLKY